MGGETRFVQYRKEEIAGTITGKGAASAIGAVGAWRKPERKDARLRIPEGRHRSSPILAIDVSAPAHSRNLNAMPSQTRTEFASDNLCIQSSERFWGSGHGKY
jgi:hypothetical protein